MALIPLEWRTNLRTNLVLWPDVAPNIASLASRDGSIYNETDLLKHFPAEGGKKAPTDARAVRNTAEVLALAGLGYVEVTDPPHFRLTDLGRATFSFLGVIGGRRFANDGNRRVLANGLIRALSTVAEYRAIWQLMRLTGDRLTNEELNRAMSRMRYAEDAEATAEVIGTARHKNDPTQIGPRLYEDDKYADAATREDQRKAMNPLFLLAGGGWLFISADDEGGIRRLEEWAVPLIDRRLSEPTVLVHADTNATVVKLISEQGAMTPDLWGPA